MKLLKVKSKVRNVVEKIGSMQEWENNPVTEHCLYVENICHSAHHWLYDDSSPSKHQPEIQVEVMHNSFLLELKPRNYPFHVTAAG